MKNKIIILIVALIAFGFTGCEKLWDMNQPKETDTEYSAVWPLAGEWWVTYMIDGSDVGGGYYPLFTYNTAAEDKDKLWISDANSFWAYTIKANCNLDARSFSGDSLVSTADYGAGLYDIKCNITNGKVIEEGGFSTSGVVCDSIYFEIEFEDDLGTIYQCAGVRRTGFLEDEH